MLKLSTRNTYNLTLFGCKSSSPPIMIRPFNFIFPVKLKGKKNYVYLF